MPRRVELMIDNNSIKNINDLNKLTDLAETISSNIRLLDEKILFNRLITACLFVVILMLNIFVIQFDSVHIGIDFQDTITKLLFMVMATVLVLLIVAYFVRHLNVLLRSKRVDSDLLVELLKLIFELKNLIIDHPDYNIIERAILDMRLKRIKFSDQNRT